MTPQDDQKLPGFDVTAFAGHVAASSHGSFVVTGVSSRMMTRSFASLRKAFDHHGLPLLILDPNSPRPAERSLDALVTSFMARLDAERGLEPRLWRLAETIERAAADEPGQMRVDGLARLWTELVKESPAVLLIVDAAHAQGGDAVAIEHFARFVYSDPLAQLAPEAQAWERPRGAIIFAGAIGFTVPSAETLDYSDDALKAIRSYLNRDDVVRRFLQTTAGDMERLGELVGRLPENAQHLALYRFDSLQEHERAVVEALSVAATAIAPDVLHDALALLSASEFFARSLRALEDQGFVRKSMGEGRILVGLEDEEFGRALCQRLTDARRRQIHRALADAERVRHETHADPEFLARHYVEAGEVELAMEFGMRAATKMASCRDFARARRMFEDLLGLGDSRHQDELELGLADSLENLGEFRAALDAVTRISSGSGKVNASIALRRGRLLARVGEYAAALKSFEDAARDGDETDRREAELARADAAYALGDHDETVERLAVLIDQLETGDLEPSVRDRAVLVARNTLGKIAMVRSEFPVAVEHFEANRQLATQWGWDEEVARAQANLGVVAFQRDDLAEATERLEHALRSSASRGSLPRAYCLVNLAAVYQRKGDFERALDYCLEAMRSAKKAGDGAAYAISARNLATIYQDLGAYERAWTIVEHLREEYENTPATLAGGWNLFVQGHLLQETGALHKARDVFERLLAEGSSQVFGTQARVRLAEIHHALKHDTSARQFLKDAEDGLDARAKYRALHDLLRAEMLVADDPQTALALAREVHDVLVGVGSKNEPVRARVVASDALIELGRVNEARTELERGLARIREAAALVPEAFQASFWRKPVHRLLAARLQKLDGALPPECIDEAAPAPSDAVAAAPVVPVQTPAFRQWRSRYAEIVGEDARLHHVFRMIDKVATANASILVYGESGTGKELVASAIHRRSERAASGFVKVNCAAFVENLLLSELFGHEKGAFTGAVDQKIGRFELADGGTIFLDEIGDISPNTQVALLRVLQEGTFERVGGSHTQKVDVRVVCATNRNLEEMVRRGEFRLDLYYRLKGVVIEMPALRDRRADISRLARHFSETLSNGKPKQFSHEALQFLANYSWPGNVRELQNFVRSILLFVESPVVSVADIDDFREFFVSGEIDHSLEPIVIEGPEIVAAVADDEEQTVPHWAGIDPEEALVERIVSEGRSLADIKKRLEMECIKRALIETGGNVTQAAEILQMKRPRLSQIINGDQELTELKSRLTG